MALGIAVAFLGLFVASRAHDNAIYIAGLALFVFGVGLNFRLIAGISAGPPNEADPK